MITRTAYSPFRTFDRSFDELVAAALRPTRGMRTSALAFDAAWKDGNLVVSVDLPGVPDDSIKVAVADRTLTVSVTRADGEATSTDERSIRLGNALDPSGVSANYRYGRLTITVPATSAPEPRVVPIEISTAPEPAAVETVATESGPAPESTPAETA